MLMSRFWGNFVSMEKKEGRKFRSLEVRETSSSHLKKMSTPKNCLFQSCQLSTFHGLNLGQISVHFAPQKALPSNSSEWWPHSSLLACQFLATNMWSTTYFPISCRGLVTKIALLQYAIEDMLLKLKNLNTLKRTCTKTEKSQYAKEDM